MAALTPGRPKHTGLRRWASVALRGLHLVTVIALGAALLGAPLSASFQAMVVVLSGVAMTAIDFWGDDRLFRDRSGQALLLKLALVALMAASDGLREPLFWLIVIWSAIFAHAPASFRHAPWWGRG